MARNSDSFILAEKEIVIKPKSHSNDNNKNNKNNETYIFFDPDTKHNIIHLDNHKPDPFSFKTTKCATLSKIIEKITLKEFSDDVFVKDFLCTYRDFTTPLNFIELLKSRYDGPAPWDAQEKILKFLKERESIREKVVAIVIDFVNTLRTDDLIQQNLRDVLVPFAETIKDNHDIYINIPEKATGRSRAKSQVLSATQMATLRFAWNPSEDVGEINPISNSSIDLTVHKKVSTPAPAISQKAKRLTLRRKKKPDLESLAAEYADSDTGENDGNAEDGDLNAIRIARELTLMEHELLCPVSTWEFLHQAWNKSKKEDMAPNILALTEWFNRSSCWFSTKIVAKDTPEHRAAVIETVIDIGMTFLQLHNYSGLMQVLACLNSSAIDRLQKTWALLSNKSWLDFQTLNNLMRTEKNFKNYRQVLKELPSTEACIPYLGMILTDYTFMDDNNPKYVDEAERMVNMHRIQLIGAKMREFNNYQTNSYKNITQTNPDIREAILSERVWDDSEIFRLSKVREETSSIKIEPGQGRRGKFGSTRSKRGSFLGNSATSSESGLSTREWELIMTSASKVQYQNGDIVFEEGIANSTLFRIIEGGIRFEKEGADGPIVVARIGEGQVFGEMSFLGKNATSATAVADSQSDSPVVLSVIETSFIDELFESEHELAATFYKHLAIMVATRLKNTVASATKQASPLTTSPSPPPASSLPLESTPPTRSVLRSPSSPLITPPSTPPATPPQQQRASRPSLAPSSPSLAPPGKKFTRSPSANSLSPLSRLSSLHNGQRRSSEQLVDTLASSTSNIPNEPSDTSSTANENSDLRDDTPAEKTRQVDIKFARRFKDLPDKVVIKVYICKFGVSGELYITKNYLCFYGKMLGMEKKKVIPWAQVTNLEKTKHLNVEKTKGTKKTTKKFLFKTASDLDEAYGIISLIWKNQSKLQLETWEGDDTDSDLSSSTNSLSEIKSYSPSMDRRRPSTTIITKNLTLAVDIPGLPTKEDWNVFMKGSKPVSYGKGEIIVHEGDKLQKVFQIIRGECVVQRKVDGTDSVITLSKMSTGDFFGEISFLLGEGASGSVVAGDGVTEVVSLGGDFVNILLSAKPLLASRFYKYLAVLLQRRLRSFQDKNNK